MTSLVANALHTAVLTSILNPLFLLNMLAYFLLRYYALNRDIPLLPTNFVAGVGGLCSFIVVFFLSSAWSRFAGIYTLAIQISGRVQDLTYLVQSTLSHAAAMRAWRYMNAAHVLAYIAVSSNYTQKNFLSPLNSRFQLLSPQDMNRVQAIGLTGPIAMREVLSWVLSVIQQEVDAGRVSPQEAVDLRKEITQFRGAVGMLLATSEMPIPFVRLCPHFADLYRRVLTPSTNRCTSASC